jgi:hypothetical protein
MTLTYRVFNRPIGGYIVLMNGYPTAFLEDQTLWNVMTRVTIFTTIREAKNATQRTNNALDKDIRKQMTFSIVPAVFPPKLRRKQ